MQDLLPYMGRVMGPLLLLTLGSSVLLLGLAVREHALGVPARVVVLAAMVAIAVVTVLVHFPLNAEFLAGDPLAAERAGPMLRRWLGWHHVRTALALAALAVLLWPLRATARAVSP